MTRVLPRDGWRCLARLRANPQRSVSRGRHGARLIVILAFAWATASRALAAEGVELFSKNCATCHGLDGKARTPAGRKLGAKDLSQSKLSDAEIEKQIIEGRKDQRGQQKMPAFSNFSAEEIRALIQVVKSFRR